MPDYARDHQLTPCYLRLMNSTIQRVSPNFSAMPQQASPQQSHDREVEFLQKRIAQLEEEKLAAENRALEVDILEEKLLKIAITGKMDVADKDYFISSAAKTRERRAQVVRLVKPVEDEAYALAEEGLGSVPTNSQYHLSKLKMWTSPAHWGEEV